MNDKLVFLCLGMAAAHASLWGLSRAAGQDAAFSYRGQTLEHWVDLLDSNPDNEVKRQAAYAIGQIGPLASSAVPSLCNAMDSRSPELRVAAADALGRIGPKAKAAVPAIIEGLNRKQNSAVYYRVAAKSLGRIGAQARQSVPILLERIENASDAVLQVEAAHALWRIERRPESLPKLIEILRGQDVSAAYRAAVAMGEAGIGSREALESLVAALRHRSADVRRASAASLAKFGADALAPVVAEIQNSAIDEPQAAIYLLGEIGGQIRVGVFHHRQISRQQFLAVAEPVMRQALPSLMRYAGDTRLPVRQAAVRAIAEFGLIAVPFSMQGLASGNPTVRASSIDALIRIEDILPDSLALSKELQLVKDSLPGRLTPLMTSENAEVRKAAYRAFAEFELPADDAAIVALLRDGLKDEDVSIRRFSSKALKQTDRP